MLRFHPHPSQCRSIGQTIGLTAYPPQRAAIFTMLPHSNLPRLFRLGALFEPLDIPTTCGAYWPLRACMIRLQTFLGCAPHLSCKGSLTPRLKSGACARANLGHDIECRVCHSNQLYGWKNPEPRDRVDEEALQCQLCGHDHRARRGCDSGREQRHPND